jgi:hypothetical protein
MLTTVQVNGPQRIALTADEASVPEAMVYTTWRSIKKPRR